MKIFKILMISVILIVTNVFAKDANVDLYDIYKHIKSESIYIQKNKPIKDMDIIDKFEEYFYNSSNVLTDSLGTEDVGDCDVLYMKPSCFKYEYYHEQKYINNFGCLYIYGLPKFKLDTDKYMIQEALLFKKTENNWKILGNRFSGLPLVEFAYAYFKGDSAIDMFADICKQKIFDKSKII